MRWGCTLDLHCSTLLLGSFVPGFAFVCPFFFGVIIWFWFWFRVLGLASGVYGKGMAGLKAV
jgi:hypothetical protein